MPFDQVVSLSVDHGGEGPCKRHRLPGQWLRTLKCLIGLRDFYNVGHNCRLSDDWLGGAVSDLVKTATSVFHLCEHTVASQQTVAIEGSADISPQNRVIPP